VERIADSDEPDADYVTEVLDECGKSLDDLRLAVELLQERRELKAKLNTVPRLSAERSRIERQIAAADAELEAADKKHAETVYPLQNELEVLKEQVWAGEQARTKLHDTCADPNLRAQLDDLQAKLTEANKIASNMQTDISDLHLRAKHSIAVAEKAKSIIDGEHRVKELQDRAKQMEKKATELEADLAKAQKAIADLEVQEKAVREQMLVP
jgi:chromosome segregation ATPase